MAQITLTITKNSADWTKMRVFRAASKELVYSGAAIFDGAIADTYADATAVAGLNYWYGIELYNASDKTRFNEIIASAITDFGPFISQVQANIAMYSSPFVSGDSAMGWIMQAVPANTFPNMPGPVNSNQKLTDIQTGSGLTPVTAQPTADIVMHACVMDGKLVVLPISPNFNFYPNATQTISLAAMQKLQTFLKNTPASTYLDVAGYRWRIKMMTKEMLVKYPDIGGIAVAGVLRRVPLLLTASAGQFFWSEADNAPVQAISNADGTISWSILISSTTQATRYMYLYYEFEGAAPTA